MTLVILFLRGRDVSVLAAPPSLVLSFGDSEINSAPRALCSSRVYTGGQVTNKQLLDEHRIRAGWRGVGSRRLTRLVWWGL